MASRGARPARCQHPAWEPSVFHATDRRPNAAAPGTSSAGASTGVRLKAWSSWSTGAWLPLSFAPPGPMRGRLPDRPFRREPQPHARRGSATHAGRGSPSSVRPASRSGGARTDVSARAPPSTTIGLAAKRPTRSCVRGDAQALSLTPASERTRVERNFRAFRERPNATNMATYIGARYRFASAFSLWAMRHCLPLDGGRAPRFATDRCLLAFS
jgi:hypothetical protein